MDGSTDESAPIRHALLCRALCWGLPLLFAVLAAQHHFSWLGQDGNLPRGDAAGHTISALRLLDWLSAGGQLPSEPYPPLTYLTAALSATLSGRTYLAIQEGVAVWAGVMAAGLCVLGWRTQGLAAAIVLPLMGMASPATSVTFRRVLTDGPSIAVLPWVVVLLLEVGCFERLHVALLLGLAIAAVVMTKYTTIIWVVAGVCLLALRVLFSRPLGLLVGALAALPAAYVIIPAVRAAPRTDLHVGIASLTADPRPATLLLGASLLLTLALRGGLYLYQRRQEGATSPPKRWVASAASGLNLAAALGLAWLCTLPWFVYASGHVFGKLTAETNKLDAAGWPQTLNFVQRLLWQAWPRAYEWLWVGVGALALLTLLRLSGLWKRRVVAWVVGDLSDLNLPKLWALTLVCAACVVSGVFIGAHTQPIGARYYAMIPVLLAPIAVVPIAWFRPTRWLLMPLLAGLCVAQILGYEWLIDEAGLPPKRVQYVQSWGPPKGAQYCPKGLCFTTPEAPYRGTVRAQLDAAVNALAARHPELAAKMPSGLSVGVLCPHLIHFGPDSMLPWAALNGLQPDSFANLYDVASPTGPGFNLSERRPNQLQRIAKKAPSVLIVGRTDADIDTWEGLFEEATGRRLTRVVTLPGDQVWMAVFEAKDAAP